MLVSTGCESDDEREEQRHNQHESSFISWLFVIWLWIEIAHGTTAFSAICNAPDAPLASTSSVANAARRKIEIPTIHQTP